MLRRDCLDPSHTASCVETHATRRGRFDYAGKFRYKETCYDVTAWFHHTLLHVLKHMPLVEEDLDYAGKLPGTKRHPLRCDYLDPSHTASCVETHATRRGRLDYSGKFRYKETCYEVTAWTHHTLLHVLKHMPLVEEDSITLVSSGTKRHATR